MLEEKDLQAIAQLMQGMKEEIIGETKELMARQKEEILDEATHRMKVLLDTEVTTKFNLLAEELDAIKAVSYTHLDVYKRQPGTCGHWRTSCQSV